MKKTNKAVTGAVTLFLVSVSQSLAIEDLRLAAQCPDVRVSWPSFEGETYIVQHRPDFSTNSSWTTLTNWFPAATGTNRTVFVHSNQMDCATAQLFSLINGGGVGSAESARSELGWDQENLGVPLVISKDGSQQPVPLPIFPPGMDLPGSVIIWEDGSAGEWNGEMVDTWRAIQQQAQSNPQALFLESSEEPSHGFYRVVRNGVHLFGLTNGMTLSGILELPVELGLDDFAIPLDVGLSPEDEVPQPSGIQSYSFTGVNDVPRLVWNTHLATNGSYTLSPSVRLSGGGYLTAEAITVNVSNAIQVPLFHEFFGTGLPIAATIASNNAPYVVTIRDEADNVIRTLTGTANGFEILNYWDGLDEFGNSALTNDYVTTTISYNPEYKGTNWIEKAGNISGQWLICYQDNLFSAVNQVVFELNMQQVATFATTHGGVAAGGPFDIRTGAGDWNVLRSNHVTQARNIYYYGHGGPTVLGYGANDPQNGVRADSIRSVLRNRFLKEDFNIRQPYRFAFLDGCQTGSKDSDWPASFGIMPAELTAANFTALGLPNRAFLGWTKFISTTSFDTSRHTFVLNFFEEWLENGANLGAALATAATGTIGTGELSKLQIWGDAALPAQ